MDVVKLRAWWAHKQGLDGSLSEADPADVLARTGWARSVGGANPYLQLFSRAGTSREVADRAAADLAIHELPSARGCTYVLPAADFALGLKVGENGPLAEVATAAKLGVGRAEIDKLSEAVLQALADSNAPQDPRQLKEALGDQVRNLGEAGKKKGVTTTLPISLGLLQAAGEIRRVAPDGRLDHQKFSYVRWSPSPFTDNPLTPEQARTELARRYWSWTGGASLAHFRWFSAFTTKNIKAAIEPLGLTPLDDDLLALPEDAAAYDDFTSPRDPSYALVSWLDGTLLLRRDINTLLAPADAERDLGKELKRLARLSDLPTQAILDRGRLIGLWEYDPESTEIAWHTFTPADDALHTLIAQTEQFVRDQLGDARGGSLDSPKSRRPRIEAIRAL